MNVLLLGVLSLLRSLDVKESAMNFSVLCILFVHRWEREGRGFFSVVYSFRS